MKIIPLLSILILTSFLYQARALAQNLSWDFNTPVNAADSTIDGWKIKHYISPRTYNNSLLLLTTPATDSAGTPQLVHTLATPLDGKQTEYVYIRLRNNTSDTLARFSWKVNKHWYSVDFRIGANDTDLKEYYIDLSRNPHWKKHILALSFTLPIITPAPSNDRTLFIDYIRTINKAPMADRKYAPFGVNLSGAEFGAPKYPGVLGTNYGYPTSSDFDYFNSKGFKLIRFPFRWERIQRQLDSPLYTDELILMKSYVEAARARGMWVVLDLHNFGRYLRGGVADTIGTSTLPVSSVVDVWKRLAEEFKSYDNIYGYDIMNEPFAMKKSAPWFNIAQEVINGIRQVDSTTTIIISGDEFSSASRWPDVSDNLKNLVDPYNNLIYQAHTYFDDASSGDYNETYEGEGGRTNSGVTRVAPFVKWLKANNKRGYVGEYGIPDTDLRWNTTMENTLQFLKENGVNGTYWSAGPRWGTYALSVQPANGQDRPQMAALEKYLVADTSVAGIIDSREQMHFWDFSGPVMPFSWIDDWNIVDYTTPSSINGLLTLNHTKANSSLQYYWQPTQLAIDPTLHKYAVIKVQNGSAYTTGRFSWTVNGVRNTILFPITANDQEIKQYVIDLGQDTRWTGKPTVITVAVPQLGSTPPASSVIVFDEIRLTMNAPGTDSWADSTSTTLLSAAHSTETSMLEATQPKLAISPNPANNSVRLKLDSGDRQLQMTLVSTNGQVALRATGTLADLNEKVNSKLVSLSPGVYVIQVVDHNVIHTSRLVKQ